MGEKLKEAAQGSAEAFSKRAFGASIGLSSGALSEILSGKRKLTLKTAGRIVELLDFGEKEKVQLLEVADPPKMESEVAERLGISLKEATETLTPFFKVTTTSVSQIRGTTILYRNHLRRPTISVQSQSQSGTAITFDLVWRHFLKFRFKSEISQASHSVQIQANSIRPKRKSENFWMPSRTISRKGHLIRSIR